jgi:predicted nucleotidyltransferase
MTTTNPDLKRDHAAIAPDAIPHRDRILDTLRQIAPDLQSKYGVTRLGIFGSVARNEASETSDIDIIVEMEPSLLKRAGLKLELETIFQRSVDVIRYRDDMNPYLKAHIDREAIYRFPDTQKWTEEPTAIALRSTHCTPNPARDPIPRLPIARHPLRHHPARRRSMRRHFALPRR